MSGVSDRVGCVEVRIGDTRASIEARAEKIPGALFPGGVIVRIKREVVNGDEGDDVCEVPLVQVERLLNRWFPKRRRKRRELR